MPRVHVGPARDDLTLDLGVGLQGADQPRVAPWQGAIGRPGGRAVRTARHLPWGTHPGQASTTRPSSPAYASGAESRRLPVPGTAPIPDRRCAADSTKEGVASAPPWGNQPDPLAGEQNQEIMCPETRHWQRRGEDQQLGRTRQRERRGSTGRAGRSKAGKRLAIRFRMDGLLLCRSFGHCRHEPHRYGDVFLV